MSYKVLTIASFEKQFKRLSKKYPSLKTELGGLIADLANEPDKGASLGHDCYKSGWRLLPKAKQIRRGAGDYLFSPSPMARYSCYP